MPPKELPELLVPAGNLAKLKRAIDYGADAVYLGASGLSMRPKKVEFEFSQLADGLHYTHQHGKKLYIALNTLAFDADLEAVERWLDASRELHFDAVIVSDLGIFSLVRELRPELAIHISTQQSTANSRAAQAWSQLGASRVILARECTLAQAKAIADKSSVEVEIFVHGAMCVAVSGRCLLSAHLAGPSASRGECKHSCRWEWQLVEAKRPGEAVPVFEEGGKTIFLGSKDLCLIEHIPALVQSGVRSLKIEGRMKSEYYVANVTRVYRAALDAYQRAGEDYKLDPRWLRELRAISHRPYHTGFAFQDPASSHSRGMQTLNRPVSTTQVLAYMVDQQEGRAWVEVKNRFSVGDQIEWLGPDMRGGLIEVKAIIDPQRGAIPRAFSATQVEIHFQGEAQPTPKAILRQALPHTAASAKGNEEQGTIAGPKP